MRPTATPASASFRHVGYKFYDRTGFHARAARFIGEGLAADQRIEFVGPGSPEQLRAELTALPGVGEQLNAAGAGVTPTAEFYPVVAGTDVVDPQVAIAAWAAAVNKAVGAGYAGLRVVADATTLARRPEQREALSRLEFLLGRNSSASPFALMCAYDGNQLAAGADELCCLHPQSGSAGPGFALHAEPGIAFALTGELDGGNDHIYLKALRRIWSLIGDDPIIIDTQHLGFVSHQQLYTLDHYARTDGRKIILRTDQGIITRLVRVLDFTNIQVQPPPCQTDSAPDNPSHHMVPT